MYWQRVMNESYPITKGFRKQRYLSGARLYNLQTDPFEMDNLLLKSKESGKNGDLRWKIDQYIEKEIAKGHQLPCIPSGISGKLLTKLAHSMFLLYPETLTFYLDTGRVVQDMEGDRNYVGRIGTDWCPDELQRDRSIFEQLAVAAIMKGRPDVAKNVQLLLDQSSLFS